MFDLPKCTPHAAWHSSRIRSRCSAATHCKRCRRCWRASRSAHSYRPASRARSPTAARRPGRTCLAGLPSGTVDGGRRYDTPGRLPDALVVHGENEHRAPLQAALDRARPGARPVVVVPGADHFFTGQPPLLRALALSHLRP
jgi:hypothetical protein